MAFAETVVFLSHFKDLPDPRQQGKVSDPLDEILLLCLLAVLAGAACVTEIALFGVKKLDFRRRFRPFRDGTRPPITSATFWPLSMPSKSSALCLRGGRAERRGGRRDRE